MNKMKDIRKYITIALMTPFIFMACTQDFLEHEPYGVMTDAVFYSTVEGITQGVTGTYAAINTCPAGLHNLEMMYLAYGSIASDEAEAGGEQGGNDIIDFQNWDKGTPQVSEPKAISQNFWGYNYKTILRANSTLEGIKTFRTNKPDTDAATLKLLSQYEGEMEFILAFTHFKLMQVYGGIPIVDHQLGSSEYGITRNTIAENLHFIQEHLLKAVELLPLRSEYGAADMGRATKGAAEAMLAKAYLYEA
ncbi:MAG: RagB/SusD family nutrient uptake outer membrane protein, partial [Prolixibacteraceae bacterium]|nr:RagB/SusD family nutrient uptake outer membrane protein [Prolixibacteraceae bacterium]